MTVPELYIINFEDAQFKASILLQVHHSTFYFNCSDFFPIQVVMTFFFFSKRISSL